MDQAIEASAGVEARPSVRPQAGVRLLVWLEVFLVGVGFLGLWAALAAVAGGPRWTDELWYIHLGINNLEATNVLNRYFHIYLQKLFIELAPTPLIGVKVFWGFLIAGTTALIYATARIFTHSSTFVHGLLAAAVFFTFRMVADYSGVTVVDITAMLMVALMVFLYVFTLRYADQNILLLTLLGFLFFLALKTKETTIVCLPLVLGFSLDADGRFSMERLVKAVFYFGLGAVAGVMFFILLNAFVLKNPLFGLTPSDFRSFSSQVRVTNTLNPEAADWYTGYLLTVLPASFLLYLFSGMKAGRRVMPALKVVWLIPVLMILFLSVSMVRGDWGIRARHLFPILPLISLLAPQFIHTRPLDNWRERLGFAASLVLAGGILGVTVLGLRFVMGRLEWDITSFLLFIVFPIVFSILIGLMVWVDRYPSYLLFVPWVCLGLLFYAPLYSNLKDLFITRTTAASYEERVAPLAFYATQVEYSDDMRILASSRFNEWVGNEDANPDILLSLFNFYFDSPAKRDNFAFGTFDEHGLADLWSDPYDYVFLTAHDYDFLFEGEPLRMDAAYEIYADSGRDFYLLVEK